MRRLRRASAVVMVMAVAAGGWLAARVRQAGAAGEPAPLVVTTTARRGDLLITVTQTGVVEAKKATPVVPRISGRVKWICENGIVVRKGDEILRLDPTQMEEQLADLTARYEEAKRRQAQADAVGRARAKEDQLRLDQAEDQAAAFERQQQAELARLADSIAFDAAELEHRRTDLEIKQRLASKGYLPESEVEREAAALKAAEFALQKARTDYELKTKQAASEALDRRENVDWTLRGMFRGRMRSERELRMTGNEVESLAVQVQRAKEDLEATVVRAPAEGLVVLTPQGGWRGETRLPRVGDWIPEGREVAQIVSLKQLQVKLELDQSQITGVTMGQPAEVTLDALPGKVLQGKVVAIGQTARRPPIQGWMGMSATATFPVTVELPPTPGEMIRPGMHATVRIVSQRIKNVILVPSGCIFRRNGKPIVYVERPAGPRPAKGKRFVAVPVTTGKSNGDYTAILSGLKEGERIALNDLRAAGHGGPGTAREEPGT